MTTATKSRAKAATATKTAKPRAPEFDREAVLAERDEAANEAMNVAITLPELAAAVRRTIEANVFLRLQRRVENLIKVFEMTYEDRSHFGDAYAQINLNLLFTPQANAPWISESDLFEGLPRPRVWSMNSSDMLKAAKDPLNASFDLKRDTAKHEKKFVMFELTVQQMRSTASAWSTTRDAMVAQEQVRLSRANTPEAKAMKELADLEEKHAELTQQLQELDEQLSESRRRVATIRSDLAKKVSTTKVPPMLKHLNDLREQLGLAQLTS